jgi:hypothetical protein
VFPDESLKFVSSIDNSWAHVDSMSEGAPI